MSRRKISFIVLLLFFTVSVQGIEVSVDSSCGTNEERTISLNKTDGGHIAEPGYYPNELCLSYIKDTAVRSSCETDEQTIISMDSKTNSHLSIFSNEYSYKVCAPRIQSSVRNSCFNNETKILSVTSNNNSHAAEPSYTDTAFDQSLCLGKQPPRNVTISLSGLSDPQFVDEIEIKSGNSITPPISYPYIVDNQPKGIVGYGQVLKISRTSADTASMTQKPSSGGFLLPFTLNGYEEIEDEQELVTNRQFLNSLSPNFGFIDIETPIVKVRYKSPYSVNGFEGQLGTGYNEFGIQNQGLTGQNLTVNIDAN